MIHHINEQIKYPDVQFIDSTPGDNGDDQANEHEAYFNPALVLLFPDKQPRSTPKRRAHPH